MTVGANGSDFRNRSKLLFFDFSECFAARLKDPLKAVTSFDLSCPTRQICVEACPSEAMYTKFASADQKKTWPCDYDVTQDQRNTEWDKLAREKKCAPYIVPGSDFLGRCLPGDSDSILNFTKDMIQDNLKGEDEGVNSTTPAGDFKAALSRFIGDMMDFQVVGAQTIFLFLFRCVLASL